jgi:hypothetical protein
MLLRFTAPEPRLQPMNLILPPGACNAHCHVFGPGTRFPYAADATFVPADDAPKEALYELNDRLGLQRCVVVQSSCHGFDDQHELSLGKGIHAVHPRAQRHRAVRGELALADPPNEFFSRRARTPRRTFAPEERHLSTLAIARGAQPRGRLLPADPGRLERDSAEGNAVPARGLRALAVGYRAVSRDSLSDPRAEVSGASRRLPGRPACPPEGSSDLAAGKPSRSRRAASSRSIAACEAAASCPRARPRWG